MCRQWLIQVIWAFWIPEKRILKPLIYVDHIRVGLFCTMWAKPVNQGQPATAGSLNVEAAKLVPHSVSLTPPFEPETGNTVQQLQGWLV